MTSGYRINELAERSGLSAARLRYYDEIGLLPESSRTPANYQTYDDRTLERLVCVASGPEAVDEGDGDRLVVLDEQDVHSSQCGRPNASLTSTALQTATDQLILGQVLDRLRPSGGAVFTTVTG